jgi:hypothetical protein
MNEFPNDMERTLIVNNICYKLYILTRLYLISRIHSTTLLHNPIVSLLQIYHHEHSTNQRKGSSTFSSGRITRPNPQFHLKIPTISYQILQTKRYSNINLTIIYQWSSLTTYVICPPDNNILLQQESEEQSNKHCNMYPTQIIHFINHLAQQLRQYEKHDELATTPLSPIQSNAQQVSVNENNRWTMSIGVQVSQLPSQCSLNLLLMFPPPYQTHPPSTRLNLAIQTPSWIYLNIIDPYHDLILLYTGTTNAHLSPAPLPTPSEFHDYTHTNRQSPYHISQERWQSSACTDYIIQRKYNKSCIEKFDVFHTTLTYHTNTILLTTKRYINKLEVKKLQNYHHPTAVHQYYQYHPMFHPAQTDHLLSCPHEASAIPSILLHQYCELKTSTYVYHLRFPSQGAFPYLLQSLLPHQSHFHYFPTSHHPTRQNQWIKRPTEDTHLGLLRIRDSHDMFHPPLLQQHTSHGLPKYSIGYLIQFQIRDQRWSWCHSHYQHPQHHHLHSNRTSHLQSQKYFLKRSSDSVTNTPHNSHRIISAHRYPTARSNAPYEVITGIKSFRGGSHIIPHIALTDVKYQLRGGGKTKGPFAPAGVLTNEELDTISISSTSVENTHTWTSLSPWIDVISDTVLDSHTWQPNAHLSRRTSNHPLLTSIPSAVLETIKQSCNLAPTLPILRSSRKRSLNVTVEHLRDFISYGCTTSDAIITLYMDLLCSSGQAAYMDTDFLPRLQQQGWGYV